MLVPFNSIFSKSEIILEKFTRKKLKQNPKKTHKQANQHKRTKNKAQFRASPKFFFQEVGV